MKNEKKSILSLALIFAFRMLGLFMILPVFSLSAGQLSGANAGLIGLALGVYGLVQAIFQMPLGMLSDHMGRKPVVALGLILFFVGSLVAAFSSSIWGVIAGRALQGAGAIGSVILALLADITKIENRTQAMGIMGMAIGFSFMLSMILGPIVYQFAGLSGIFSLMALLALCGLLILHFLVENPVKLIFHQDLEPSWRLIRQVVFQPELMRLNIGILIQHAMLTASFMAIPKVLSHALHVPIQQQWIFYLAILVLALGGSFPVMILSERKRFVKQALLISIAVLGLSQMALIQWYAQFWGVMTVLSLFFFAFTLLEAFLPSLISKIAPVHSKGTAMGVYSSCQFLGIFLGGSIGGMILLRYHLEGVFLFCGILAILWLLAAIGMKSPPYLTTLILSIKKMPAEEAKQLSRQFLLVKGVSEAAVIPDEEAIYLKIDKDQLDEVHLEELITTHSMWRKPWPKVLTK